jgi:epoxyqueuosine reductase QueG
MATTTDSLRAELERFARSQGIDLFGVADLAPARDFIARQGGNFLGSFPRAISLGIHTSNTVVDQLPHRDDPRQHLTIFYSYRAHSERVGQVLEETSRKLVALLEEAGYSAFPAFRGELSEEELIGSLSQKLPAHLAGMGWIGKNCLLVTPQFGPRLRLASVLTDAPLAPGSPAVDRCADCTACVEVCPPKAIRGVPFRDSEPREARFRAQVCRDYCHSQLRRLGVKNLSAPGHVCGLCLYICPFGRG